MGAKSEQKQRLSPPAALGIKVAFFETFNARSLRLPNGFFLQCRAVGGGGQTSLVLLHVVLLVYPRRSEKNSSIALALEASVFRAAVATKKTRRES